MNKINPLAIGTQVSSGDVVYTIDKILGQGGFGITYKVSTILKYGKIEQKGCFAMKEHFLSDYCERNQSKVVFSEPLRGKVTESLSDFVAEARRLHALDHPNIVAVNEVFETNSTAYYVMEYIEGKSLRQYVSEKGPLTEDVAMEVITPVLNAIGYLHGNRMTHLDVKPDNIMLKPNDDGTFTPILIDFGLSKHYDETGKPTSTIRIQGCSDGYAPLEQYVGLNSFSPQADIYALGATLLYMLTGLQPLVASEQSKESIMEVLPSAVSEKLKNAIVHAMSVNKAGRTATIAEFASELGVEYKANSNPVSISKAILSSSENGGDKKDDNATEIISGSCPSKQYNSHKPAQPEKDKPRKENPSGKSSSKWLIPLLTASAILLGCGIAIWFILNGEKDGADEITQEQVVSVAPEHIDVPEADTNDNGYSAAYAEALNLYNSRNYKSCKAYCQSLLSKYTEAHQLQQLNQLIGYCDTALQANAVTPPVVETTHNSGGQVSNQSNAVSSTSAGSVAPSGSSENSTSNSQATQPSQQTQEPAPSSFPASIPSNAVDLGLSVMWANANVGSYSSSDYGRYYKYGEASGAAKSYGSGWRLPTKAELEELCNRCSWTWTGAGYRITGPSGKSIYMPAAGYYNKSGNLVNTDIYGGYWSSTSSGDLDAYFLNFVETDRMVGYRDRTYSRSVRPVFAW